MKFPVRDIHRNIVDELYYGDKQEMKRMRDKIRKDAHINGGSGLGIYVVENDDHTFDIYETNPDLAYGRDADPKIEFIEGDFTSWEDVVNYCRFMAHGAITYGDRRIDRRIEPRDEVIIYNNDKFQIALKQLIEDKINIRSYDAENHLLALWKDGVKPSDIIAKYRLDKKLPDKPDDYSPIASIPQVHTGRWKHSRYQGGTSSYNDWSGDSAFDEYGEIYEDLEKDMKFKINESLDSNLIDKFFKDSSWIDEIRDRLQYLNQKDLEIEYDEDPIVKLIIDNAHKHNPEDNDYEGIVRDFINFTEEFMFYINDEDKDSFEDLIKENPFMETFFKIYDEEWPEWNTINENINEAKNPYFTPYGYRDAAKVLNRTAPTYYWHLKEIEMDTGDGIKLANYALKKGLPVMVDPNDDPDYPTFYLEDGSSIYHWDDYFYPYETSHYNKEDLIPYTKGMFNKNESLEQASENIQFGVHQFSTESIIFRGTEDECIKYIDERPELWDDAEVYFMTPDDPHYRKNESLEESIYTYQTWIKPIRGEKQPAKILTYGSDIILVRSPYTREEFGKDWKRHIRKIIEWCQENNPGLIRLTHDFRLSNFPSNPNSEEAFIAAIEDKLNKGDYILKESINESKEEKICCICKEPYEGYGNNAEPVCSGTCCDKCNIERVIPMRFKMMKNDTLKESKELNESYEPSVYEDDDFEDDVSPMYYVYKNDYDVVSDEFDYEEDAIEWAKENGYPIVKIHRYYIDDEDGGLNPAGDPEIVWKASEYTEEEDIDESLEESYNPSPKMFKRLCKSKDEKLCDEACQIMFNWYANEDAFDDFDTISDFIDFVSTDIYDMLDAAADEQEKDTVLAALNPPESLDRGLRFNEAVNQYILFGFEHFSPDNLWMIKDSKENLEALVSTYGDEGPLEYNEIIEDKGNLLFVEHNDEFISVHDTGYKSIDEIKKALYDVLDPMIQADLDAGQETGEYEFDIVPYYAYIDELTTTADAVDEIMDSIENSYVDGDSNSEYRFVDPETVTDNAEMAREGLGDIEDQPWDDSWDDDSEDINESKELAEEVEEGLIGDISVNLDASGSSVGFLGGTAGAVQNEALIGDIDVGVDASGSSVGFLNGQSGEVINSSLDMDDEIEEGLGLGLAALGAGIATKALLDEDADDNYDFDEMDEMLEKDNEIKRVRHIYGVKD